MLMAEREVILKFMKANFIEINSSDALTEVFRKSSEQPVVLFKHSLTCPISASVYNEMKKVDGDVHLVVVQSARSVSNEIAQKTGIRHESPQAIVLKDGNVVYSASHFDVTADDVESFIND